MSSQNDYVVQATNDDATGSKAHAVKRGYWKDAYIRHFCPMPTTKPPEISRGYFVRTQVFKAITLSFVKDHNHKCQVVNLGAGSDTLYFQLRDEGSLPDKFVELDLPYNVNKKVTVIKQNNLFTSFTEPQAPHFKGDNPTQLEGSKDSNILRYALNADRYSLFSFDLREPAAELLKQLCAPAYAVSLDPSLPTLFLAECVLVYMNPMQSSQLIRDISANFARGAFLLYEQVNMCDKFGEIMVNHFRSRGCDLPGLSACDSLTMQKARFMEAGWKNAKAWTVNELYQAFPSPTKLRIQRVEILDDLEISRQLFDHYCILLAVNDDTVCPWTLIEEPLSMIS